MADSEQPKQYGRFFSADRPIQGEPDDKLGRAPFAHALADAVAGWHQKDSLVIALYGPWGIGKSSIKNLALAALSKTPGSVLVAQFNPWAFANRDQLMEAFFDQVGIALGEGPVASKKDRQRLLRKWQRYAAYLKVGRTAADLLRKPLGWLLVAGAGISLTGRLANLPQLGYGFDLFLVVAGGLLLVSSKVAETLTDWFKIGTDVGRKSLEDVKGDLAKTLSTLDVPVLVVLDDLDRLTPAETLEMLQIVKVNADLPNVVFLLMCDRDVVAAHLESALNTPGDHFLEKIVQVAFDVPTVDRLRMIKVLTDALDELLSSDQVLGSDFDQVRWGNVFVDGLDQYFKNLRDVNRFLSTLAFHVSLFRGSVAFEVNFTDLIALEVFRVFDPKLYQALSKEKALLTSQFKFGKQDEAEKMRILGLLEHVPAERRERVKGILKNLFPPAEWAFGGSHYGADYNDIWERERRVCAEEAFDRYFHLALPKGDISQDVIAGLVATAGDREQLARKLADLKEAGDLDVALDRLEAHKTAIPVASLQPFVTALLDVSDGLTTESPGMFGISPMMHVARIVHWSLQSEEDRTKREAILLNALRDTTGLAGPVYVVALEQQALEKDETQEGRALSADGLEQAKAFCVEKIRAAAQDATLVATGSAGTLYRWRDWAGEEEVRAFCETLAASPAGALRVLEMFLQRAVSSGLGDRVSRVIWFMKTSELEKFVSLDLLEQSLAAVNSDTLTQRQSQALEAFRKAMARRKAGKPEGDGFFYRDDDE